MLHFGTRRNVLWVHQLFGELALVRCALNGRTRAYDKHCRNPYRGTIAKGSGLRDSDRLRVYPLLARLLYPLHIMKNMLKPLALIVVASAGLLLASGQAAQAQSELLPPACCDGLNVCCCANHCISVGGNAYCW